uniref:Uncharacterized protein n=1 Tax=Amphiprion ocellaris TaxID=80972 RepID=A0AAQ5ZJE4_AMPOC
IPNTSLGMLNTQCQLLKSDKETILINSPNLLVLTLNVNVSCKTTTMFEANLQRNHTQASLANLLVLHDNANC